MELETRSEMLFPRCEKSGPSLQHRGQGGGGVSQRSGVPGPQSRRAQAGVGIAVPSSSGVGSPPSLSFLAVVLKVPTNQDPRDQGLGLLAHGCLGALLLRSIIPHLPPREAGLELWMRGSPPLGNLGPAASKGSPAHLVTKGGQVSPRGLAAGSDRLPPRSRKVSLRVGLETKPAMWAVLFQSPWGLDMYLRRCHGRRDGRVGCAWRTCPSPASTRAAGFQPPLECRPPTALSKQKSAAQNKSLRITGLGDWVTGRDDKGPVGLEINPSR